MKALQKFSFFFFVITISLLLRILCFNQKAGDMVVFLLPWFDDIVSNGGVAGLHQQVGNYGLLYQTLLALLTSFKNIVVPIYLIKFLSIVFDYVLAYSVSLIVKDCIQGGNSVFKIP